MKKKENIIIIALILVMIVSIIGVSYAAYNYSKTGTKVNSITTGSITMSYTESDNVINIDKALPTTDDTGKVRLKEGEYFDFTVSSEIVGDININYEISAKDVTVGSRKIDGSNIKLYLTRLTDDGEEELMTPETYNEESSANSYTGRPAGEMSLYTSSMSSSESNNYRLRMWVDEDYNPQDDGGNLQFSVKVNVYGKDGEKGNDVPLTTQQILEDNEIQVEKTNMFNYASNGMYISGIGSSGPVYSTDESQVTNGLYSMNDEDGTSYYYRGNVNNNNVQFGEYASDYYVYNYRSRYFQSLETCQEYNSRCSESNRVKLASAGDKMYWKIVRVNGDGSLRLIYNGTSVTHPEFADDISTSNSVGKIPYNLEYNDQKYAGYTYDNGTDSFIKKEVDTWYTNAFENTEYDSKVGRGRFCSDSSNYHYDEKNGYYVFASWDRLAKNYMSVVLGGGEGHNLPTLKCPETTESYGGSYRLKAGLITADELVLAGENVGLESNSYLNIVSDGSMLTYWSMTPVDFRNSYAGVLYEAGILNGHDVGGNYAVRPVINVTTDNGFTSGDGTASSPYTLS